METKINIAEILKDKPVGLKFYSNTFGYISFNGVHKDKVYFFSEDTNAHSVKPNGKMYDGGECIIFPSKEMRDWAKFSWKKGDVLANGEGDYCVFKEFAHSSYQTIKAVFVKRNKESIQSYSCLLDTKDWHKASHSCTATYINTIEKELSGKLNMETLEIEKVQPEFKDGDIIYAKSDAYHYPSINILNTNCDTRRYYARLVIKGSYDEAINYDIPAFDDGNPNRLRLATEEEKQQLFDALAKEGKRWDSEKKQIVDLKPKVDELKPFDKVLVRDDKEDQWSANIFSYQVRDMFHCLGEGYWRYCIPYEGNEHLLGTTKDVEV